VKKVCFAYFLTDKHGWSEVAAAARVAGGVDGEVVGQAASQRHPAVRQESGAGLQLHQDEDLRVQGAPPREDRRKVLISFISFLKLMLHMGKIDQHIRAFQKKTRQILVKIAKHCYHNIDLRNTWQSPFFGDF
jgi:hypothetical protein